MAAPAVRVSATRIQRAVRRRFYLKWVVVDTETAALHGAVIQVAVVGLSARLSPLLQYREYWSNVDSSIDPRAEAVHHISAEDLRAKGRCPTRGLSRLQQLLRSNKHRGDVTFVARACGILSQPWMWTASRRTPRKHSWASAMTTGMKPG